MNSQAGLATTLCKQATTARYSQNLAGSFDRSWWRSGLSGARVSPMKASLCCVSKADTLVAIVEGGVVGAHEDVAQDPQGADGDVQADEARKALGCVIISNLQHSKGEETS